MTCKKILIYVAIASIITTFLLCGCGENKDKKDANNTTIAQSGTLTEEIQNTTITLDEPKQESESVGNIPEETQIQETTIAEYSESNETISQETVEKNKKIKEELNKRKPKDKEKYAGLTETEATLKAYDMLDKYYVFEKAEKGKTENGKDAWIISMLYTYGDARQVVFCYISDSFYYLK